MNPINPITINPQPQPAPAEQTTWPDVDQLIQIRPRLFAYAMPFLAATFCWMLKPNFFTLHILDITAFIWILPIVGTSLEPKPPLPDEQRLHAYLQAGGLNEQFAQHCPTAAQIRAIHNQIQPHWKIMAADGLERGKIKLHLPNGRDFITLDPFIPSEVEEWCVLKISEEHFNLVKATTMIDLIQRGASHPISRQPLQPADFIRGKALLSLFKTRQHSG